MLRITVRLLNNAYRADPDGSRSRPEWPPAPSRVLDALVDAGNGSAADGWAALEGLYGAPPPMIYATPRVVEQEHAPSYAATQRAAEGEVQGMPGRLALLVQRGPKVSVADPQVHFVWAGIELPGADLDALADRASLVSYLGCADSTALLSISALPPRSGFDAEHQWRPLPDGEATQDCVLVNVASPTHLAAALRAHTLTDQRDQRRARQRRTRHWYRPPTVLEPPSRVGGGCVWLQFGDSQPAGSAVKIAYSLKAALMGRWADHAPAGAPWWVTGHDTPDGVDYQLARFLVLPAAGHEHADGRLHGACLWIPDGAETQDRTLAAALARTLGAFHVHGIGAVATAEYDPDSRRRRWAATPRRWTGPERQWVTVLPALNDRHGFPTAADVARWCARAGLPPADEASVRVSRRPLLPGGVELREHQIRRPKHRSTRGFAHVSFKLAEPVNGPVAIGAGRSYGLGLCAPDKHQRSEP